MHSYIHSFIPWNSFVFELKAVAGANLYASGVRADRCSPTSILSDCFILIHVSIYMCLQKLVKQAEERVSKGKEKLKES